LFKSKRLLAAAAARSNIKSAEIIVDDETQSEEENIADDGVESFGVPSSPAAMDVDKNNDVTSGTIEATPPQASTNPRLPEVLHSADTNRPELQSRDSTSTASKPVPQAPQEVEVGGDEQSVTEGGLATTDKQTVEAPSDSAALRKGAISSNKTTSQSPLTSESTRPSAPATNIRPSSAPIVVTANANGLDGPRRPHTAPTTSRAIIPFTPTPLQSATPTVPKRTLDNDSDPDSTDTTKRSDSSSDAAGAEHQNKKRR
ncbi:hypothetical protein HK102_012920, partial [Quaeritorhiza haematococci]